MSGRAVLAVSLALLAGPALAADKPEPQDGGTRSSESSERQSSSSGESWTKSDDSWTKSEDYSTKSNESWTKSDDYSTKSNEYARSSDGSSYTSSDSERRPSSSAGSWTKTGGSGKRSGRSSNTSSDRRESRPPTTAAQRRHPRPGTGTGAFRDDHRGSRYGYRYGGRRYYSPGYSFGFYSRPYYYSPYYYGGYYPSYYGYGYGPYRRGSYRDAGSLRIIVQPERTRVYVDGYYAGVADDFDGIFQRLNVSPGRHDIMLRLDGYRTQHFKVYVPYDQTIKIHYDMVRGSGESTSEDYAGRPADDYARFEGDDDRWDRDEWGGRDDDDRDAGTVRLEVRPRDASVYVDGAFHGRQSTLRLAPGRHRIEVVHPGYRTVEREVDVRPGRTTEIEVELDRN